jgi:ankyrin repeat protein
MVSALHWAANKDHLDVVKFLLTHHAKVDIRELSGTTPLMVAAGGGASKEIAAALISSGADVNARDERGMTALAYAANYNGRAEMAAMLIRKGADIEAQTKDFDRPLSLAAEKGNGPAIHELLKAGANVGFALVWEIYKLKPKGVQALIDAGADVNARYPADVGADQGTTPLIEAARANDPATAALLIEHGADTNAVLPGTSNMPTALTYAAYHCNADMIRLLLAHRADRAFRNASGKTAADLARTGWTNDMQPCPADVQSLLQ